MTPETLRAAVRQAEEILRRAKLVPLKEYKPTTGNLWRHFEPSPQAAAVKRASMDLTRALADMRRVP